MLFGAAAVRYLFRRSALARLLDVLALVQRNRAVGIAVDLDAEQIVHRALVGDRPIRLQRVHEAVVLAPAWATAVGWRRASLTECTIWRLST